VPDEDAISPEEGEQPPEDAMAEEGQPEAEVEAGPLDPFANLPTQDDVDIQTMVGNLGEYRRQLAAAKLAFHASRAGVPKLDHADKIAKDIKALHSICDLIELFLREGHIPEPSKLLVVDGS
jgi:hypothetical protein